MFLFNTNPTVCFALALIFSVFIDAKHFNGGTIRWEPVNPNDTSNLITITITQTYYGLIHTSNVYLMSLHPVALVLEVIS